MVQTDSIISAISGIIIEKVQLRSKSREMEIIVGDIDSLPVIIIVFG